MKLTKPVALLGADIVFPLRRDEGLASAAKKLPGASTSRPGASVRGTLLSSSDADPYFVRYALDDEDIPNDMTLFRVTLRLRPTSPPPKEIADSRENGETAQTFFQAAQKMITEFGFDGAVFEARLRLEADGIALPSVVASPVAVEGSVLELTGATYRAASTPKTGLFVLSWHHEPPADTVFMRVGAVEPNLNLAASSPWETLIARCGQLLAATS